MAQRVPSLRHQYRDVTNDLDLIFRKRSTIHLVAIMALLTVAYTHSLVLVGITSACVFAFCLLPPMLLSVVQRQGGTASLYAAKTCLFLERIYPLRPKKHTGLCFEVARYLFSHARESVTPYHISPTPQDLEFLRTAPGMSLAETQYHEAQAFEALFVQTDPEDDIAHLRNVAIAHEELGYLYRCQRLFEQAGENLRESAYLSEQIGDADTLALSTFRLAEIDHVHARREEAEQGYETALVLFRKVGNQRETRVVETLLRELSEGDLHQ